jgi:hypothetical protein
MVFSFFWVFCTSLTNQVDHTWLKSQLHICNTVARGQGSALCAEELIMLEDSLQILSILWEYSIRFSFLPFKKIIL